MAVKFSKCRKVRVFPKAQKSEATQIWWSNSEYEEFHKVCWRTIHLVRGGASIDTSNKEYCPRGLEHWSEDKRQQRQNQRMQLVKVVLREQERQKIDSVDDPVAIAKLCEEAALACQFEAHIVGLRDEDEARHHETITAAVPPATTRRKRSEKRPLCIDGRSTEHPSRRTALVDTLRRGSKRITPKR
jgi:hypothetical protein